MARWDYVILLYLTVGLAIPGGLSITFEDGEISSEVSLQKSDSPHYVRGFLNVTSGGRLTVEAGSEVYFSSTGGLNITGGQLVVNGTEEEPVLFDLWKTDDTPETNRTAAVRFKDTGETTERGRGM